MVMYPVSRYVRKRMLLNAYRSDLNLLINRYRRRINVLIESLVANCFLKLFISGCDYPDTQRLAIMYLGKHFDFIIYLTYVPLVSLDYRVVGTR